MNTILQESKITVTRKLTEEHVQETQEPLLIVAMCDFAELMETIKLVISVSNIGTVTIVSTRDTKHMCHAYIITERFGQVTQSIFVSQEDLPIGDWYESMLDTALDVFSSGSIFLPLESIINILRISRENVTDLMLDKESQ